MIARVDRLHVTDPSHRSQSSQVHRRTSWDMSPAPHILAPGATGGTEMRREEHHIQDACELYAVARLQEMAEDADRAIEEASDARWKEFRDYIEARDITFEEFRFGDWSVYYENAEKHLPTFFKRLADKYPEDDFLFESVEVDYRNENKKGDFVIHFSSGEEVSVSLKNYRKDAGRPQLHSGTFNSFILRFLFEADGVGMSLHPDTGERFKGSIVDTRDEVLRDIGYDDIIPLMHELDEMSEEITEQFAYGEEFEFLTEENEPLYNDAAAKVGHDGAEICVEILDHFDDDVIRGRILDAIGLDGAEEALFFDSERYTDSITVDEYHELREAVNDPDTRVIHEKRGQGIAFEFVTENDDVVLSIFIPFTINKNGAWISGDPYEGTRYHKKEDMELAYGQRRPKKSKQIATSINTWVNLKDAGIFLEGES